MALHRQPSRLEAPHRPSRRLGRSRAAELRGVTTAGLPSCGADKRPHCLPTRGRASPCPPGWRRSGGWRRWCHGPPIGA
eukprot:scaffold7634_cov30-Phaeocystis_antarctica.AAC.1